MAVKKIITVRHVFERDYEVEVKNDALGAFAIADCMVCSGHDIHEVLTHETIFDNPISKFRTAKGMHINDCNLYNISQEATHLTGSGDSVDAWLLEGETESD